MIWFAWFAIALPRVSRLLDINIMAPQPLPIMVPQTLKHYGAIGIEGNLV
jgi:hypothetical protein